METVFSFALSNALLATLLALLAGVMAAIVRRPALAHGLWLLVLLKLLTPPLVPVALPRLGGDTIPPDSLLAAASGPFPPPERWLRSASRRGGSF